MIVRSTVIVLFTAALAAACAPASSDRILTVFAAASLTEAFDALEERFERDNPSVDVQVSVGGSARLGSQISEGARADVFASADEVPMRALADAGVLEGPARIFATNTLTIAVARGNPAGIGGLADLERAGLTVVTCAPQVPCGRAAMKLERIARVAIDPASEEQDVKAVLAKVRLGEADAGLVYRTDVRAAADAVDEIAIPAASAARNSYPVAVLADAGEPVLAAEFREFVLGAAGRRVFEEAGFGAPPT